MLRHQALGYTFASLPHFILSQEIVTVIIPILEVNTLRLHNLPEMAQPHI